MNKVYLDNKNKYWLKNIKDRNIDLYILLVDISHLFKLPKGLVFGRTGIPIYDLDRKFKESFKNSLFKVKNITIDDTEYYFNIEGINSFLLTKFIKSKTNENKLRIAKKYNLVLKYIL